MDLKDLRNTQAWSAAAWTKDYIRQVLYPDPAHPPGWLSDGPAPTQFSKQDWDGLFGDYEAATDLAALYAVELIKTYPNARVILVERDVDSWAESLDKTVIQTIAGPAGNFVRNVAEPLAGMYNYTQLWDVLRGWARVKTVEEMRAAYRSRYHEHYDTVRKLVPPDRLLDYKLGDGWEPICQFLGKPKPEEPFPRVNEGKDLVVMLRIGLAWTVMVALWQLLKYPLLLLSLWLLAEKADTLWGYLNRITDHPYLWPRRT